MNRRDFLKTGAGAFAIAAGGKAMGADAPSNRVRLAMIGCNKTGLRGRGYQIMCRAAELPGAEVATVCDVDTRAMDFAASEVQRMAGNVPKKMKDIRDVLADPSIDGIICATPDHWHAWMGVAAMKAGKAVYMEKPLAFNAGEAEVMARVQKETGAVFQLGTQRRSSYASQLAIEEIRKGSIGEPRYAKCWCLSRRPPVQGCAEAPVPEWLDWDLWQGPAPRQPYRTNIVHYNWRFFRHWGTGDCPNNGLHFVDIARWALNADWPERVVCGGGHLFYEEDWNWFDSMNLTVEFPGKKVLTWEGLSHVDTQPFMNLWTGCLVYGLGGCALFGPKGETSILDPKGKTVKSWAADAADPAAQEGDNRLSNPTQKLDGVHMKRFVDCARQKDVRTAATMDIAIRSNLLTEMGNVSQLTGEAVHIDPATGKLKDPKSAAAKYWTREYEKGWKVV